VVTVFPYWTTCQISRRTDCRCDDPARYRSSARFYDLISAQWPIYLAGRGDRPLGPAARQSCPRHRLRHGLNVPHLQRRIGPTGSITAVESTYALSLMPNWPLAVSLMVAVTRCGGRVAVVDMQKPVGRARVWTPLAQLACLLGGSDIGAHPWTAIESSLTDVDEVSLRGGHVQVRVGSVRKTVTGA